MQTALILEILEVAEKAAIAAAAYNGRGDKHTADQVATEAMREAFNAISFAGRIVIGEGERDEAPMLFIGEQVGSGWLDSTEPIEQYDIAVDPLEGTNLCAYNRPNALTTIAVAPRGTLLYAPDTYMWKLAAGAAAAATAATGALHIDNQPSDNIAAVASALAKPVSEVNVCILKRDRHNDLIAAVRATGARIRLIDDGDVFGAIATAVPGTGIDLYMGSGGAPEGVLAATGLKAIGGFLMGRLDFSLDKDGVEKRQRAKTLSQVDLDSPLLMNDLVGTDDAVFIACGVTDGEMLAGVHIDTSGSISTSSVIMNAADSSVRFVRTIRRGSSGVIGF
ncbi:MAG: class II fructose-bisphosphatase [Coriobacteriales bacterium]|jgi:fructose-1,6-bisphosphatase class II|nr:class II fructose-bisphosphatase [Coriobacteriales bacterium]